MVRLEGHQKTYIQSSRPWECGTPNGFPKSVGRVGSRHHGFPCFPYLFGASMAWKCHCSIPIRSHQLFQSFRSTSLPRLCRKFQNQPCAVVGLAFLARAQLGCCFSPSRLGQGILCSEREPGDAFVPRGAGPFVPRGSSALDESSQRSHAHSLELLHVDVGYAGRVNQLSDILKRFSPSTRLRCHWTDRLDPTDEQQNQQK